MAMKSIEKGVALECCMCGDPGFSDQLFQCKLCHFRSQHRYCSNVYPKARSYGTCNWCLIQTQHHVIGEKSPISSNSTSSFKDSAAKLSGHIGGIKKPKNSFDDDDDDDEFVKNKREIQLKKPMFNKRRSPEAKSPPSSSPPVVVSTTRKRIITNRDLEEKLRRTKSDDIISKSSKNNIINNNNNNGLTKQVFRNKVRRYKLLEEVIS